MANQAAAYARTLLVPCALIVALYFSSSGGDPSSLLDAADTGDEASVESLLRCGIHPDVREERTRMTPLMYAARRGNLSIAQRLLDHGADPNAACNGHGTPLAIAARAEKLQIMRLLLERGSDPNLGSPDGTSPLMNGADTGDGRIVRLLINAGANVNAQSDYGYTALMVAAWNGDAHIVDLLMQSGADPNVRDSRGATAADSAATWGHHGIAARIKANTWKNSERSHP
jgi:ankyrin repeat protein